MAPTIAAQRDTAANGYGWNNTDVASSYTASDVLAGLDDNSPAAGAYTFTTDGEGQSHTFTVTDKAGNTATATVSDVNIDTVAPTIAAQRDTAANGNGWNNTDVASSYMASDVLAGLDDNSPAAGAYTFTTDGEGQSHTFTVTDKAGNTATATVSNVNIDTVAPTITGSLNKVPASTGWYNLVTGVPTYSYLASDGLSGLETGSLSSGSFTFGQGASLTHTLR